MSEQFDLDIEQGLLDCYQKYVEINDKQIISKDSNILQIKHKFKYFYQYINKILYFLSK